jgi:superfamily II DNA/RNA helicase
MLDMGFMPDIERIFKLIPFTRQTLFFSATMPPEITRLATSSCMRPSASRFRAPRRPAKRSRRRLLGVSKKDFAAGKRAALRDLIRAKTSKRHHLLQPQA